MVMVVGVVAVGDGGDMAVLRCFRRWWWCVVVVAVCVRGRSLFVVVIVGGHRRSWCGWSLSLMVVVRGRGTTNKHCLLFITNT